MQSFENKLFFENTTTTFSHGFSSTSFLILSLEKYGNLGFFPYGLGSLKTAESKTKIRLIKSPVSKENQYIYI